MMATYKIQIDDEVRNATPEEAARIDAQRAEAEAQVEAVEAKAAARQAVLDKLGLTADEAAALFG
jgi:ribosomal protein L9